jgi:hypothetical protein
MENFVAYNPVKLHFGKNAIDNLGFLASQFGKRVLLLYGKGSIKNNGIYERIIDSLILNNHEIYEYSGIKSNPIIEDVVKAVDKCKTNHIDLIVAVGGGSVIDSAKLISVCVKENIDPWQVMKNKIKPKTSIPLLCVLTLAATGSEMNPYAVIQNHATGEKIGYGHPLMYPKFSFLNPEFTYSVNKEYTAYGAVDIIAHVLESYFAAGEASLSDRFAISIIKEVMEFAPKAIAEPNNYDYRASLMWASTCALNGTTAYGRSASGDWGVHDIGHTLSFLYDIAHGASLSIAYPAWLKWLKTKNNSRIKELSLQLFGEPDTDKFIQELEKFFQSIQSPVKLSECNIDINKKDEIINLLTKNKISGYNYKLEPSDYKQIVDFMY